VHVCGRRGIVLADPDDPLSPADVRAEFASTLVQQALQPRLREPQPTQRRIGEPGEVHLHAAEREPGSRAGARVARRLEPVQQTAVAQQVQDLPAEAACLRRLPQPRLPLQHQRPHTGKAQLARQHQPGRARSCDDHVGIHHRPPLP
jgi:hypothetical protein